MTPSLVCWQSGFPGCSRENIIFGGYAKSTYLISNSEQEEEEEEKHRELHFGGCDRSTF